jgi:CheY-like chemotaxis protein
MKGLRVLIIEDDPIIALLYEDVLIELGHEVCASECTQAGVIAAASRHQPDLIIADMRLTEGRGIDALKAIMTSGFVPHVFISGDRLALTQANTAAVTLQKPFDER